MTASPDLIKAIEGLNASIAGYLEAEAYYEGVLPERFVTEAIRKLVEGQKRYRFRFAKIPVNVVKTRCQISAIRSESESETALIESLREGNDLDLYEPWITERWLVHGDAYVMAWPVDALEEDETNEDQGQDSGTVQAGVEISYQSPLSCRAFYDTEDGKNVQYVIRRWQEITTLGKVWRAEMWYSDRCELWTTLPGGSKDASGADDWVPWEDPDAGVEPVIENEWGEIPIKHLRSALPYGRPEHADAYGPQDAITKAIVTQVEGDLESHGWPERYRIADDTRALDTARDAVAWGDETVTGRLGGTREDGTARQVDTSRGRGAGREHVYSGTKTVGTFDPPDPGVLIAPIEAWVRWMSTVTETPLYEFDPNSGAQLSGVSRDKADRPLNAKVRERRRYMVAMWCRELWPLALRMAGVGEPARIEIVWTPPDVQMETEWWTAAGQRMALGVPVTVVLAEAGYVPDEITGWLDDQGEEAGLDQRISRVKALGEAMSAMAAAVSLGLVSEAEASGLFKRIMKEAQ